MGWNTVVGPVTVIGTNSGLVEGNRPTTDTMQQHRARVESVWLHGVGGPRPLLGCSVDDGRDTPSLSFGE